MEENNIMTFTPQQLKDLGIYFDENQDSFELYFDENGNASYSQEQSIMITNHIIPETQETELTQSLSPSEPGDILGNQALLDDLDSPAKETLEAPPPSLPPTDNHEVPANEVTFESEPVKDYSDYGGNEEVEFTELTPDQGKMEHKQFYKKHNYLDYKRN